MNVGIMQSIPNTFCPAKWDELNVSFESNYAYGCCKSTPTVFTEHVLQFVNKEQLNLLNDIQDPSCNYCWAVENNGGESLRNNHLKTFDINRFDQYLTNPGPKQIQVTIGNECNFQCTYCNPKFSSRWEQDVLKSPYRVFSDRYFWGIDIKHNNVMEKNIEFLKQFNHIECLSVIGGEPLFNKRTFELIDSVVADSLQLATNLSCKKSIIDSLFERCSKYKTVILTVSIDATDSIAEFTRYGLVFKEFSDNFNYLLNNRPDNLKVIVNSVMTSITVRDFVNFSQYLIPFLDKTNFEWHIEYCKNPVTQSMSTLPNHYKDEILVAINEMMPYNIQGLGALHTVIYNTAFNRTMHQQLKHFMQEFAARKKITVPLCLD
jgi:molybdenum cofactor biosynthesis enzyme MoaA